MRGKKWVNINQNLAENIYNFLIQNGGEPVSVRSPYEVWRIKIFNSTFTFYTSGTLYSTYSTHTELNRIYDYINKLFSKNSIISKLFTAGIDEAGKGEIFGDITIAGVCIPSEQIGNLTSKFSTLNTKKKHNFNYWQSLYNEIVKHNNIFIVKEKISPYEMEKEKINKLLDIKIISLIEKITKRIPSDKLRIVIDNYGITDLLKKHIERNLKHTDIIIKPQADEEYIEVKLASAVAKYFREKFIKSINENSEYFIDGIPPGSGNLADKTTIEWLKKLKENQKPLPQFVRKWRIKNNLLFS